MFLYSSSLLHSHLILNFSVASTLVYTTLEPLSSVIVTVLFEVLVLGYVSRFLVFILLAGAVVSIVSTNIVKRTEREGNLYDWYLYAYIYTISSTYLVFLFLRTYEYELFYPTVHALFDLVYFYKDPNSGLFIFAKTASIFTMQFTSWYFSFNVSDRVLTFTLLLSLVPITLIKIFDAIFCRKKSEEKEDDDDNDDKSDKINKTEAKEEEKTIKTD